MWQFLSLDHVYIYCLGHIYTIRLINSIQLDGAVSDSSKKKTKQENNRKRAAYRKAYRNASLRSKEEKKIFEMVSLVSARVSWRIIYRQTDLMVGLKSNLIIERVTWWLVTKYVNWKILSGHRQSLILSAYARTCIFL